MKHTETKKKGNLSLLPFIWVGYSSSSSTLLNRFHLILNTKYTDLILCSLSVLSIFYTSNAICYKWNASSIRWHMDTLRRLRTVEMMPKKNEQQEENAEKRIEEKCFRLSFKVMKCPSFHLSLSLSAFVHQFRLCASRSSVYLGCTNHNDECRALKFNEQRKKCTENRNHMWCCECVMWFMPNRMNTDVKMKQRKRFCHAYLI